MKCLLTVQATVGVALTNDESTSTTTTKFVSDPIVCDAQIMDRELKGAAEQRSRNSLLQREMHSGELGRCFPGCTEKI